MTGEMRPYFKSTRKSDSTPRGVYYDLALSPIYTDWNNWRFVFSSECHKRNFDKQLRIKIDWLNDSLTRRFKLAVNAAPIAVMQLYFKIETRGFRVIELNSGKIYKCSDDLSVGCTIGSEQCRTGFSNQRQLSGQEYMKKSEPLTTELIG